MTQEDYKIIMDKQHTHSDQQGTGYNALWSHISKLQECLRVAAYPRRGTWEEQMSFEKIPEYIQSKFTLDQLQQ